MSRPFPAQAERDVLHLESLEASQEDAASQSRAVDSAQSELEKREAELVAERNDARAARDGALEKAAEAEAAAHEARVQRTKDADRASQHARALERDLADARGAASAHARAQRDRDAARDAALRAGKG